MDRGSYLKGPENVETERFAYSLLVGTRRDSNLHLTVEPKRLAARITYVTGPK
jgi:hypothetical protein